MTEKGKKQMAEYLDKWGVVDKLIRLENNYNFFKKKWDKETLYRRICELEIGLAKTAGLEIVRCKDCRDYKQNPYSEGNEKMCMCWGDWIPTEPDDFCSYAERKNDEH